MLITHVECEHVFYELINEYIPELDFSNVSAQIIIDAILSNTRFTANVAFISGMYNLQVQRKDAISSINQLLTQCNAEIKRDNFAISISNQIGNDNGVQFRYRKNLRSIKRTVKTDNLITRLYVYGKDNLTIPPIDSPNISDYPRPKSAEITFSDIEDTTILQQRGEEYLNLNDIPLYIYEADVIELKDAVGYDDSEGFALGDTIHIYDDELDIRVTARIVEYEYYPFEPEKSRVILANFVPEISDVLAGLNNTKKRVDRFTDVNGNINTYWLDGKINTLKNQLVASGEYQTADILENQGFLIENNDTNSSSYGAMYIGPGIFALADERLGNGDWNWRSFGNGSGFTADEINTGIINASVVRIQADTATYIDGTGLHVLDPNNNERLRIGEYESGKYGIKVDGGSIEIVGGLSDSQINSSSNWNGKTTLLTSNGVYTGTVAANQVITNSLSAITANLGTVTTGTLIGTSIIGSIITGSTIQTASTSNKIIMDSNGFRSHDTNGTKRISIDTFDSFGYQELRFYGQNGTRTGVISGTNGFFNITSSNGAALILGGSRVVVGADVQEFNFQGVNVSGLNVVARFA